MDLIKFTELLNSSVRQIKNLAIEEKKSTKNAHTALNDFIPNITEGNRELSDSSFEEIKSSAKDATELAQVRLAIQSFLKTAEKRTGAVQAALFEDPQFKKFMARLVALDGFLKSKDREKGKVQGTSFDGL